MKLLDKSNDTFYFTFNDAFIISFSVLKLTDTVHHVRAVYRIRKYSKCPIGFKIFYALAQLCNFIGLFIC